jgi:hypothetical protein
MKFRSRLCLFTMVSAFSFLSIFYVRADIDPATKSKVYPVPEMQAKIWQRLDLTDLTLNGIVHSDKSKNRYPVILLTHHHELVYEFKDQPLQIRVTLTTGAFTVERRSSSTEAWTAVPGSEMKKHILDTDITYEDLGIDFMNWDDVNPVGTDAIKTLPAYVYDATPGPNDHNTFAKVRFWVSTQYWCFLRVDGLNSKGQTIKRVEAQDVMTIADKYNVFKEMKVATMAPDKNDIANSTTYIDIQDGHEGSGLTQ